VKLAGGICFVGAGRGVMLFAAPACRRSGAAASAAVARPTRSGNTVRFDPGSPQLERIRVAPATQATLAIEDFEAPAKIEPVPTRLARVALPAAGRVRSVAVTLGDRVRAGQPLLTVESVESSELQSAWRQAKADTVQRQAALAKAEVDLSRARDLLANRGIAQKEVLSAETELGVANAALEQARATQDDVARRLRLMGLDPAKPEGPVTLRAPIAGEVVEIAVAPGEYRHDTTAPVLSVADLSTVWLTASVPERALSRVESGNRVAISLAAYPDRQFEARVARVSATLDAETRTARMIVELPNPQRLFRPEMFARVRYTGAPRPVVTVPIGAVVRHDRRTTVFVERARGTFERREVTLGPRHADTVVVTNGLEDGDRVVVDGTMLLMGQ
jgi:cobalt-zinc-cadmium efflux system membrane fusion protein